MSSALKTEPGEEEQEETCCVCGAAGTELSASADLVLQPPLAQMLLHLNNNRVVPEGRLCPDCVRRTVDAYNFSTALASKGPPPLSEKIRALRQRLHELTQKIDVFIVVGGGGAGGAYSEQDIIMVERGAAPPPAPEGDQRGGDARGAPVYQCSVCPLTFTRMSEFRAHVHGHGAACAHTCWWCGARCPSAAALQQHVAAHAPASPLHCHLCNTTAQSSDEARRHESSCPSVCPVAACARAFPSRAALRAHAAAHGELCGACLAACATREERAAHVALHRRDKHFVCGYHACILRFTTRSNLLAHIRKCHADPPPAPPAAQEAPPAPASCPHCPRVFGSQAAMKRHARTHVNKNIDVQEAPWPDGERVEYLEVETLEELE